MTDLDPAVITAQHAPGRRHYCCGVWRTCTTDKPCLPYRLAAEATLRGQVQRVNEPLEPVDLSDFRAARERIMTSIASGECRCPDERHQNLLHSFADDTWMVFQELDRFRAAFKLRDDNHL